jgi:phage terminase large subunit-like protein
MRWIADDGAVCTGPRGIPARTLGWAVLGWILDTLSQPDGPDAGEPFTPTNEQARFILWFYAVDESGRFLFRRAVLRRAKGWGKDPLAAALCAVELLGPCRFGGWDSDGNPIVVPASAPWIQTAAVSREQTRNTMTLFPGLFPATVIRGYGLHIGKEIIYNATGGRIEAVTSSPRALEGARPTLVVANETHHWVRNNGGTEMASAIRRNLAKNRNGQARLLEITNAHMPGEESVAEQSYEAWQAVESGKSKSTGLLYDSREAPPETILSDRESLRRGLISARGDSHWLDVERLIEEIYDPSTPASVSRRFYLNQVVAAEDAWTTPHEWDSCAVGDGLAEGDLIALGFDGSKNDDATALIACRIDDGLVVPLGIWEPPDGPDALGWEVPRDAVAGLVDNTFTRYGVVAFYADVAHWESYVDAWSVEYGPDLSVKATTRSAVAWDMRARQQLYTRATEAFGQAIESGTARHNGDLVLRRHVLNARRRPNRWGITFGKEHRESARKVDALAAAVLARMARQDYLTVGKRAPESGVMVL